MPRPLQTSSEKQIVDATGVSSRLERLTCQLTARKHEGSDSIRFCMSDSTSSALHRISVPDVIVILPVYNEAEVIADVTREWLEVLDELSMPYRLHLCNDGSTDGTQEVLDELHHPCLEIHHAKNRGHGPTVLRAYRSAAERAAWVFQCDSDREIPATAFPEFWRARHGYDFIIGNRVNREDRWVRAIITRTLTVLVWMLFGRGISDVNCPYRLMRSEKYRPLFDQIPEDTFAPNVIISAFALRERLRILTLPVEHTHRETGAVSIRGRKLLNAVSRATRQTLAFRFSR